MEMVLNIYENNLNLNNLHQYANNIVYTISLFLTKMVYKMLIMFVLPMLVEKIVLMNIEMNQVNEQVFVKYHHQKMIDIPWLNQVKVILNLENKLKVRIFFQI